MNIISFTDWYYFICLYEIFLTLYEQGPSGLHWGLKRTATIQSQFFTMRPFFDKFIEMLEKKLNFIYFFKFQVWKGLRQFIVSVFHLAAIFWPVHRTRKQFTFSVWMTNYPKIAKIAKIKQPVELNRKHQVSNSRNFEFVQNY